MTIKEAYDKLYDSYKKEIAITNYPSFIESYRTGRRKTFEAILKVLEGYVQNNAKGAHDEILSMYNVAVNHGKYQGDYLIGIMEVYNVAIKILEETL